jgi:ubiquinone/menaquinone biosynthesis C-methylase UbiE
VTGTQAKYDAVAARYDARWSFYVRESIGRTLAHLNPRTGHRVLDVGCGTGQLLGEVAARWPGTSLVGIDPSPRMLQQAKARVPSAHLVLGTAESLPAESASVDWLVTTSAFHYVRDPFVARREFRRVLRPGGTLVLTDWSADFLTTRLQARWSKATDRRFQRIYTAIELQAILVAGGFDVTVETYKISWYWGLLTARARKS